jgi:predicted deacylase
MKHLGILDGEPEVPEKYLVFKKRWRVNPSKGGYLFPNIEPERLLTEIEEGELLGTVVSPYTFEEVERLESPGRGILFYTARTYPVRPGDWAFGVIDLSDPDTRWE